VRFVLLSHWKAFEKPVLNLLLPDIFHDFHSCPTP